MTSFLDLSYKSDGSGLFCCLHKSTSRSNTGVLCVQPIFGEYIQHHRAFFELANHLAAVGMPCLRYDHYGTGDSADDLTAATVSRWCHDVESLAAELVDRTGVEQIVIVGARFGATLALGSLPDIVRAIGLVLWEPVWDGSAFWGSLLRTHERVLGARPAPAANDRNSAQDVLGFEVPYRVWSEIQDFAPHVRVSADVDVLLIGSAECLSLSIPLQDHERITTQVVNYPCGWLDPDRGMYDVLVPHEVLTRISEWIRSRNY